jgi:hypothetical protein
MCLVIRAVEQCYRLFALGLDNRPPPIGISFEFREILDSEFISLCWIVFEPLSQFRAGSDMLKPEICFQFIRLDTEWPQSVNEKSDSVFSVDCVVNAHYFDHHLRSFGG